MRPGVEHRGGTIRPARTACSATARGDQRAIGALVDAATRAGSYRSVKLRSGPRPWQRVVQDRSSAAARACGSSGGTMMPRPSPSVAGKPSTSVPITGTPCASPMIAVCENDSSRDGIASTVAPAMYAPGSRHPAEEAHPRREAELADLVLEDRAQVPVAEDQRRGRSAQQPERREQDVGTLVGVQAAGEDDAGTGQAGAWPVVGSHDRGDALAYPLERQAVREHRGAGARPVGEEDVDAIEPVAHLARPGRSGHRYWLCSLATSGVPAATARAAAHQAPNMCAWTRSAAASRGASQAAKRGSGSIAGSRRRPRPRLHAVPTRELEPVRARPAAEQRRGDPAAAQLGHHAQHRQLRATRFQLGDDSRDEHDPSSIAAGGRPRVKELAWRADGCPLDHEPAQPYATREPTSALGDARARSRRSWPMPARRGRRLVRDRTRVATRRAVCTGRQDADRCRRHRRRRSGRAAPSRVPQRPVQVSPAPTFTSEGDQHPRAMRLR